MLDFALGATYIGKTYNNDRPCLQSHGIVIVEMRIVHIDATMSPFFNIMVVVII